MANMTNTNPSLRVNMVLSLFTWCCMHLSSALLICCVSVLTAAIAVLLYTPIPAVCQPIWPWADVIEHSVSIITKPEWKYECNTSAHTLYHFLTLFQVITNDHLKVKPLNRTKSDLGTELTDSLFLLGPAVGVWGAPDSPVGYLSLQAPVGLLQPVHLLQEAPQSSI